MLEKKMNESTSESKKDSKVYEVGYLLVPSLPAEKVSEQTAALYAILTKHSATVIAEEGPSLTSLSYEMDKSSSGGSHQRFDQGYFGWVKFFCSPSSIEEIRKDFDRNPNVLRTLAIATVKEKTYLGKRAKSETKPENKTEEKPAIEGTESQAGTGSEQNGSVVSAPMTPAEMAAVDKKLDEMVKGA